MVRSTFCTYLYVTLIIFVSINISVIIVICATSEEKWTKAKTVPVTCGCLSEYEDDLDGNTKLLMANIAAVWIQPRLMLLNATAEVWMLT